MNNSLVAQVTSKATGVGAGNLPPRRLQRLTSGCSLLVLFPTLIALLPGLAYADFSKTITVTPDVQLNAVTTWYYASCTKSLGLGSYSIETAPSHGTLAFSDLSGPVPGCPPGSPSLLAAAAFYTWTDTSSHATSDFFQLYYELNGNVAEVIDVTVNLASESCTISSQTLQSVPGVPDSRIRIGVGEVVELGVNFSPVTWEIKSGGGTLLSDDTGTTFIAPYSADTSVIAATLPNGSCSITFSTVQPSGLIFQRLLAPPLKAPGYGFFALPFAPNFSYAASMYSVAFLTPGDVSFAAIGISEQDIPNPYVIPNYDPPVLVSVGTTKAWLIGCDYDLDRALGSVSKESDWVYTFGDNQQTAFSTVETDLSHTFNGLYTYTKTQIRALSANGDFVDTPRAVGAILTVPWGAPYSNLGIQPLNRSTCETYVGDQFTVVPNRQTSTASRAALHVR